MTGEWFDAGSMSLRFRAVASMTALTALVVVVGALETTATGLAPGVAPPAYAGRLVALAWVLSVLVAFDGGPLAVSVGAPPAVLSAVAAADPPALAGVVSLVPPLTGGAGPGGDPLAALVLGGALGAAGYLVGAGASRRLDG